LTEEYKWFVCFYSQKGKQVEGSGIDKVLEIKEINKVLLKALKDQIKYREQFEIII